jgi:chromosome partitioning protein
LYVIAIASQKGGCGKTTTTVNLGSYLALKGKKVLLIDLDPQASATAHLGINCTDLNNMSQVMAGPKGLDEIKMPTCVNGLDIAPTNNALRKAKTALKDDLVNGMFKLSDKIKEINGYDYVLIDAPPSLGILCLNALIACNMVIVPVQVEYFALKGLTVMVELLDQLSERGYNPKRRYLLTMCDNRRKLTGLVSSKVRSAFGDDVFRVTIPENVKLAEAPIQGKPICIYDPSAFGATAYSQLADEVMA